MTINGIGNNSYALYAMEKSSASSGIVQSADSGQDSSASSTTSISGPRSHRPPSEEAIKAAKAKLQETDPALAKKMEEFQAKMEQMKNDGTSESDVRSAMKANMDSLSDTEKSELKSVFGGPPGGMGGPGGPGGMGGPRGMGGPGGPGGPGGSAEALISALKKTNPSLASKIEDITSTEDSSETSSTSSTDTEDSWKKLLDSLSDTDKSDLKKAMEETRPKAESSSNTIEAQAKAFVQQALSAYQKSASSWYSQLGTSSMAVAA